MYEQALSEYGYRMGYGTAIATVLFFIMLVYIVFVLARIWRQAIDRHARMGSSYAAQPDWHRTLAELSEGSQTTLGAYHRPWQ